jgi:hypothetical protein
MAKGEAIPRSLYPGSWIAAIFPAHCQIVADSKELILVLRGLICERRFKGTCPINAFGYFLTLSLAGYVRAQLTK